MILAIGNAGGNIVETIRKQTEHAILKEAKYIFADCDESDLKKHEADDSQMILLDAEKYELPGGIFDEIEKLVIIAGLGGKTGTKFTELAVKSAKESGVKIVVAITTLPFAFEGGKRLDRSVSAAKRIMDIPDVNTFCLNNDELHKRYPDLNFLNAFNAADKEILYVLEKAIENIDSIPHCELHVTKPTEVVPKRMYIFSTARRFKSEVRERIKGFLPEVSGIEIYLFNAEEDYNATFMSRALALELHIPVNIMVFSDSLMPPNVNKQYVIIDAIVEDPGLLPLRGGFKALEKFISSQHATIHKI